MFGFGQLIEVLKKSPKKIVFTEGSDPRILEGLPPTSATFIKV